MRKTTIVRIFVVSMAALVGGLLIGAVGGIIAWAGGSVVTSGPDVTGFRFTQGGVTAVTLVAIAALMIAAGTVLYLVSWIGAMVNASQLHEPTWFLVVLLTGVFGVGIAGMIAYAVAAPDATKQPPSFTGSAPPAAVDRQYPAPAENSPSPVPRP